jgi:hypothetical protein
MPQLIYKLSGDDFLKGLSLQTGYPIGGLWQVLANYDPFKKFGRLYPTLGPTQKDGGNIPLTLRALEFYSDGTDKFLFGFGDNTAGKLAYKINLATDAITDFSSAINGSVNAAEQCSMVKVWNGRLIYDRLKWDQSLRSVAPAGTDDKVVLGGLSGNFSHPKVVGPDGYLYVGNGPYIARLILATGTTGNVLNAFDSLQTDLICRDLDHDGQYIFAGFDNNSSMLSGIMADCQVIIWDRFKAYAEKRYPLKEAYIIGIRVLDQTAYIFTPSGIYACSIATPPKLVYPFGSESPFNRLPADYNQISKDSSSIFWGDKAGSAQVLALGQKIAGQPKLVYQPYTATSTTENQKALIVSNSYIYVSTDKPRIYKLNDATGQQVNAMPVPKYLPQPYTFSFSKVILKTALGAGDEVTHQLFNSDDEVISGSETQGYATPGIGAKKNLIFRRTGSGATINDFTDVYPQLLTNVEIAGLEIYGDPLPGTHNTQL